MLKKIIALLAFGVFSLPILADEVNVKQLIEEKLNTQVTSILKSPYLGLYEIYANGQIFYTDEKVTVILAGNLIDGKTMTNMTAERLQKLTAVNFSELPLELAIKQVRGNGKRIFASFEDPNCGFCKKLAKEIAQLDNVTIYTFLYPILSPDSLEKSNQIWCSKDREKTWNNWIVNGIPPSNEANCDTTAVQKSIAYGRKIDVKGTPTIFFANGDRVPGVIPLSELDTRLNNALGAKESK